MEYNSVNIEIGGKTRKMVATMQNLYDIEENIAPLVSLIKKTTSNGSGLKISEMIDIIYYGLNGNADNRLERKSIENAMFEKGYMSYMTPVQSFLLVALSGGDAQEKGASEPAPTTAESPTS